jgi:hypothetical protein
MEYTRPVERRDLEALLSRGWDAAARSEEAYFRALPAAEKLRISDELRRSAQMLRPDWPSAPDREADLACHVRVAELLRRVPSPRKR